MKTGNEKKRRNGLDMRGIFKCMMEGGFYPSYEISHIFFEFEENTAVVEYEEGVLSVRIFFSIEPDTYDIFKEVSNTSMSMSLGVKAIVVDDRKNLMFSCEFLCDTEREFRKFFTRGLSLLKEAVETHKSQMRKLILGDRMVSTANIPAADELSSMAGISKSHKVLS